MACPLPPQGLAHFVDLPTLGHVLGPSDSKLSLRPDTYRVGTAKVVFVASCHSKSIGELFLKAGARGEFAVSVCSVFAVLFAADVHAPVNLLT